MGWETGVLNRLTPRDFAILMNLYEHGVLTTDHIAVLHFGCAMSADRGEQQVARRRLRILTEELQLLERFLPLPYRYALSQRGATIVSASIDRDVKWRSHSHVRFGRHLPHRLAAVDFYVVLVAAARAGSLSVATWLGERSCRERWGETVAHPFAMSGGVIPDGYGEVVTPNGTLRVCLEIDRGTEPWDVLVAKMQRYNWLSGVEGNVDAVLLCFTDEAREARAAEKLPEGRRTVATSTLARHLADPLGPNWRVGGELVRLTELGARPKQRTA